MNCLITAGPTREYFDPVRFISNPSSGKMGYAIAQAALDLGWEVNLVSGPVAIPAPENAQLHKVMTGDEMFQKVDELFPTCDILIMTAAVCDMRPKHFIDHKVKKDTISMSVEMEATVDILKTISKKRTPGQTLVGFAAETNDVEAYARKKRIAKNIDWIVANQVGGANNAFESDSNSVLLIGPDESATAYGPDSKAAIAQRLIKHLEGAVLPSDKNASSE